MGGGGGGPPPPPPQVAAEVQGPSTVSNNGTSITSNAFAGNVVIGNVIVVVLSTNHNINPTSVTDSVGNTYTQQASQANTTDGDKSFIYSAPITIGGKPAVTVAWPSSTSSWIANIEVSGITSTKTATGGRQVVYVGAPPQANALAAGLAFNAGDYIVGSWESSTGTSFTAGTNYTVFGGVSGFGGQRAIGTVSTPTNPTTFPFTDNNGSIAGSICFCACVLPHA